MRTLPLGIGNSIQSARETGVLGMIRSRLTGRRLTGRWLIGLLIGLVFVLPVYWVLVIATGHHGDAYAIPPVMLPALQFGSIWFVLTHTNIVHYFLNSVLITSATIVLVLVTGVFAGWGLAAYHYRGREALFLVAIGVMLLPQQALIVTQFNVMFHLGLLDSYAGLILPFGASSAAIFLFARPFSSFPRAFGTWPASKARTYSSFSGVWQSRQRGRLWPRWSC